MPDIDIARGKSSATSAPLINAHSIVRSFGAVRALRNVSLSFRSGEVHGLVGANGAGKSTFLNVLAGAVKPDSGTILIDGVETSIPTPKVSEELGFAFIHQELALVPDFSAIDNMTLGLRGTSTFGFGDTRKRARISGEIADRLGITFNLRKPVRTLSVAERGLVAIGRALARDARFIAMDEPTAALSDVECSRLFRIVRELARDGVSVAYVSHRLGEIEELSDSVTVFKDGAVTGRFERGGYDRQDLIRGITGDEKGIELRQPVPPLAASAPVIFSARRVSDGLRVHDASFEVHAGEVLGIAGVVGAGRSELLGLAFGEGRLFGGAMTLNGKSHRPRSVHSAVQSGVAFVPEERRSQALVMSESLRTNITLGNWRAMRHSARIPFISDRKSDALAKSMIDRLRIKATGSGVVVSKLSGGNQQKVVFGRWLAQNADLFLLDEPTRGVDIGARQQIWETVEKAAAGGKAVVIVSSELDELAICHRVVILVEGRTVGELIGPGVTEEQMLAVIYEHKN